MAITTYWDNSFKVKTLRPNANSNNSIPSGTSIPHLSSIELGVATNSKMIVFYPEVVGVSKKVLITFKQIGLNVYDSGNFQIDLGASPVELPLEGISSVKVENINGSSIDLFFLFLQEAV